MRSKPADDAALRRVVAASLLDVSVRHGDPYRRRSLPPPRRCRRMPMRLKPLDAFAASGVPNAAALCRELITIVPKLAPPAAENRNHRQRHVDRLQAGAAKLVRVQRADATGNDRGSVVARVTAAALRNDLNEARRELNTLAACRSRRRASLARQGRCPRRGARRLAQIRQRRHGRARASQPSRNFMIRIILFLALIAAAAAGAAWVADQTGDVVLSWGGWRVETTLPVFVLALGIVIVAAMLLWSILRGLWRTPDAHAPQAARAPSCARPPRHHARPARDRPWRCLRGAPSCRRCAAPRRA